MPSNLACGALTPTDRIILDYRNVFDLDSAPVARPCALVYRWRARHGARSRIPISRGQEEIWHIAHRLHSAHRRMSQTLPLFLGLEQALILLNELIVAPSGTG